MPSEPTEPSEPMGPGADAFAQDLDAAAAAGLSLESFTYLTDHQFDPGQLAEFLALDPPLRRFVLGVLADEVNEEDWRWFDRRDDCKAVADWMLRLPALRPRPPW